MADPNSKTKEFVRVVGTRDNPAGVDELSNALITLGFDGHKLHDAKTFLADYVDESIGSGATHAIAFKTPATSPEIHMDLGFKVLVSGDIEIFEGASWATSTGTQLAVYNRNRNNAASSAVLEDTSGTFTASDNLIVDPNIPANGLSQATPIHHVFSFGAQQNPFQGERGTEEFILKANTQYVVLFTSGGANNKVQLFMEWNEHTNSNA
jgi:hypothetical protein